MQAGISTVSSGRAPATRNGVTANAVPVLWHLKVSNYNEKARWALDYKAIPHVRRPAIPGQHVAIAKRLSGRNTFPVLQLDGETIGDSTEIIAALERRYPDRPLYPSDPGERCRALELEDFFDEELGPYVRTLVVHHMLPDARLTLGAFFPDIRGPRRLAARAMFPAIRRRFASSLAISSESVELAFEKLKIAGERFSAELQPSGYLVGDKFTVADLTLAALVAPAVAPEQFPYPQPQRNHPRIAPVREVLDEYGVLEWTRNLYAFHRGPSAEIRGAPGAADPVSGSRAPA
jgi:glutathione S-transferase